MSNENSQVAERELLDIIEAQPTTVIASMARELIRRRSEPSGVSGEWKAGDEAITSGSGERITLLRLQGHDIYSGPASDGRLWICRLSVATKPSDAVEFGVRECNMRPVPPPTCECRQPCSFCVQVIDEPDTEPLSMPSGCSAFFIESVPGETWAVTTACAEHKYLEGQPFTREPGPIHPCRAGCVYERASEPVANPRKKFDDLVARMAPESRARVDARAAEMLREMCNGCDGHSATCGLPDFCCNECPDIAASAALSHPVQLTSSQRAWVEGKAGWEGMSAGQVLTQYEVPIPEHLNNDGTARRCKDCRDNRAAWDHSVDPSPDVWHLSISPGVTRCGADYPSLCMTDVRAKVTCGFCTGHSWRCSTHGTRGYGYTSLSLAMDDADGHIERSKTANGLCSIRTYSGDEPSAPTRRDPDCPYCVRLHPDERCTCVPSVNAPVLSVEQPHYVMYSLGAKIGCVVGERARDAELRLQPAGTRFKKTAREGCALHVHRSGWNEKYLRRRFALALAGEESPERNYRAERVKVRIVRDADGLTWEEVEE